MQNTQPAQTTLRHLLNRGEMIVAPGAFDPMAARLVERNGFQAVYMTGAGTALARFGLPDVGLLTMTEMADSAGAIAQAISIPLIADADTGYGNEINVRRTVHAYERAGVAGLHIEDQVMPKKCGHLRGKRLISNSEMASKVRAACDARIDENFVIIARCDALAVTDMDDVIERCNAYVEAGADAIFVESPTTIEELQYIPSAIPAPVLLNVASSRKTPYLSTAELASFGYRIAIFPNFTTLAAIKAMDVLLGGFRKTGDIRTVLDQCASFEQLMDLAGLPAVQELEQHYQFPEDAITAI